MPKCKLPSPISNQLTKLHIYIKCLRVLLLYTIENNEARSQYP